MRSKYNVQTHLGTVLLLQVISTFLYRNKIFVNKK